MHKTMSNSQITSEEIYDPGVSEDEYHMLMGEMMMNHVPPYPSFSSDDPDRPERREAPMGSPCLYCDFPKKYEGPDCPNCGNDPAY